VQSVLGQGTIFFCYIMAQRYHSGPKSLKDQRRRSFEAEKLHSSKRHKGPPETLQVADRPPIERRQSAVQPWGYKPPVEPCIGDFEVIHVLIVEDNPINQRVLSQQLTREGCVTHTANHGIEAVDFLLRSTLAATDEFSPSTQKNIELSIILLDVEMPVMVKPPISPIPLITADTPPQRTVSQPSVASEN
jgi:CheY-like chemotaxis protein